MNTIETRMKTLEQSLQSLKASYPTVGQNVKFYVLKSQVFTKTLETGKSELVRIKYTPDYGMGKPNIISLKIIVTVNGAGGYSPSQMEVQDGSGEVVANVKISATGGNASFNIIAVASGTLPGKFSML